MSTEHDDFLDGLTAELTGGAPVPDQIDDDTPLPNELANQVEEYDAYAKDRDAHLADVEAGDEGQQQQRVAKQVPLTALQEERTRRQQATAELERERAQSLAMRQQFDLALQQQAAQLQAQQQAEQHQQIPAFEEDPEGHVRALAQQFEQRLESMQHQQVQAVQAQQVQQVIQAGTRAENELMAEVGEVNYRQAFDAVHGQALQALRQAYPQASEQQLQWAQQNAILEHAQQCLSRGENPARVVYEHAQRMGYKPGHRTVGQRPTAPTSLSNLPGAGAAEDNGRLTAAKVNAMSDAEFEQLCASMKRGAHRGPGF